MVRSVVVAMLAACGGDEDGNDEDTCDDLGVTDTIAGTLASAHDVCVVSSTIAQPDTLNSFIASVTPLRNRESLVHDRCFGVDDNGTYDRVVHTHDVVEDAWTEDAAVFDGNGAQVWLATSAHGPDCNDDAVCETCCAQSCCDGEPVSGTGTGDPVALRDCVLVSEQHG